MMTEPGGAARAAAPSGAMSAGDARVDAVIDDLAKIDTLPVSDHVELFADAHSQLQDVLNAVTTSVPSEVDRPR